MHDDADVFLTELGSKPADDFVSVTDLGILSTSTTDDSPTQDVLTQDMVDPQPVEVSPELFSVDMTRQDATVTTQPTRSSGQKLAKVLEVTIPLRTQTYPTLVNGKTAEKCDNAELSGQSDLETLPKKSKSGSQRKKRK